MTNAALPATELGEFFGPGGALSACLERFAPRPEQLAMAEAVAACIRNRSHLFVEAGTGTGKTLAYLAPLLLAGRPAIVSTATRTLQDQLFHRDLPMLGRAIGRPARVRLLKGRRNYLCLHRLEQALITESPGIPTADLARVSAWAERTRHGDIAELAGVSEQSPVWPRVTASADSCLGSGCPRHADCHVLKARQAARGADIVVVNHHLLLADMAMKGDGFGDLLPGADVVVIDEAQHFPDIAQLQLTRSLGSQQLRELLQDAAAEAVAAGAATAEITAAAARIEPLLAQLRRLLPGSGTALAWQELPPDCLPELEALLDAVGELAAGTAAARDASPGLRRCAERAARCRSLLEELLDEAGQAGLRWLRLGKHSVTLNLTPLDAAGDTGALLAAADCSWIFTSATLAVDGDFAYFGRRLGLTSAEGRLIPSPFDYARNARLYLPPGMPDPGSAGYTAAVVAAVRPVLEASRGRAFLLFTSHRALREAAGLLRARAANWPLLVQGEAPRTRLLEQFQRQRGAVLLGTATFWEGVDIRGSDLVLVVIDRLPFASPGDPLQAARLAAVERDGGNPFREQQLPQAVLALKQGVGRLIRDYSDYGVIMLCDPRVKTRGYGRRFLRSLPAMPVLDSAEAVRRFFAEREAHAS